MAKNFLELWLRMCRATPSLNDEDARMTIAVKSFKAQLEKAYKQGAEDMRSMVKDFDGVGRSESAVDQLFGKFFGK